MTVSDEDLKYYMENLDTVADIASELLQRRQADRWVPVEERLPEGKQDVLVIVQNNTPRIEKACYIPPHSVLSSDFLSDEYDCESVEEYDAESDCYWVVEGWWESSWESEANWKLSGDVTHWRPLTEPPEVPE